MAVYEKGLEDGVLMIPGHWFKADDQTKPPQKEQAKDTNAVFFRGTFASVPHDKLVKAMEIFGGTFLYTNTMDFFFFFFFGLSNLGIAFARCRRKSP